VAYETIEFELADGVALLRFDRPEVLNSLNDAILQETRSVLKAVSDDPEARVLLMTGNGRAFCAGADLSMDDQAPGLSMGDYVERKMEALSGSRWAITWSGRWRRCSTRRSATSSA
jgi:2-(1,2-epoxy-1,2-dihydrophenyl)acetyl-CoA isomerase